MLASCEVTQGVGVREQPVQRYSEVTSLVLDSDKGCAVTTLLLNVCMNCIYSHRQVD